MINIKSQGNWPNSEIVEVECIPPGHEEEITLGQLRQLMGVASELPDNFVVRGNLKLSLEVPGIMRSLNLEVPGIMRSLNIVKKRD